MKDYSSYFILREKVKDLSLKNCYFLLLESFGVLGERSAFDGMRKGWEETKLGVLSRPSNDKKLEA